MSHQGGILFEYNKTFTWTPPCPILYLFCYFVTLLLGLHPRPIFSPRQNKYNIGRLSANRNTTNLPGKTFFAHVMLRFRLSEDSDDLRQK